MPEENEHMMTVDEGRLRQSSVPVTYPSNSRKAKEKPPEKKRVEKAFEGDVVQRPRGVGYKLIKGFFSEDSGSVVSYVLLEVLLPAAKNMIVEAGEQALQRVFFGEARPRRGYNDRPGYVNYQRPADRREPARTISREARTVHDFDELELPDRISAIKVLDKLDEALAEYGVVSVAELYDALGITGEFTDNKWGWTNLSSATVRQVRGGRYVLVLPPTKPLT